MVGMIGIANNNDVIALLKAYDFKINKNHTSFYKYLKRKDNLLTIRLSNHFNYISKSRKMNKA